MGGRITRGDEELTEWVDERLQVDSSSSESTFSSGRCCPNVFAKSMYVCMYTQYSDSVNFQVMTITQRDQH